MPVGGVHRAQVVDVHHQNGQRPFEAIGALELLRDDRGEMTHVVEPGLRLDASGLDQAWDRERPISERQGKKRENDERLVDVPEGRCQRSQRNEAGIDEDTVEANRVGDPNAPREAEHEREQAIVNGQEDCDSHERGKRPVLL
jgi:hypothetical protein